MFLSSILFHLLAIGSIKDNLHNSLLILFEVLSNGSIKDNLCVSLLNSLLPSCNEKLMFLASIPFYLLAKGSKKDSLDESIKKIAFMFLAWILFCLLATGSTKDNIYVSLFDSL